MLVSTLLAVLFTCVQINLHLLPHYLEDERRQVAFSCFLLTSYSLIFIILYSLVSSGSGLASVSLRWEVILLPLGFGTCLTLPDSLHIRSDVDEIGLKYSDVYREAAKMCF